MSLVVFASTLAITAAPAAASTFSNSAAISTTRPATCGAPPGQATVYPSAIAVSGLTGTVSDVNVKLTGMGNDWAGDFEIFLVGPGASPPSLVLLSDAGQSISNLALTFDDAGAALVPNSTLASPLTAKPTDYNELVSQNVPADTYPLAPAGLGRPAPTGSATLASTFNGINPNGTWNLYVLNDACDAPSETITNGWSLDITTANGAPTTTSVTSSVNPSATGQSVNFKATVLSSGSPVTTGSVTFTEGATTLAANVALNGLGEATFTTSSLAEGNHVITATYNGVPTFNTSNGSVNQIVDTATTNSGGTFCNAGAIAVRPGSATPYASHITVSGLAGTLATTNAQLKNVSHPFSEDIDVLLVGPTSTNNIVLASDAGTGSGIGGGSTTNVTANFTDAGTALPATGPWGSANSTVAARPTDYTPAGETDTFPSPLPPASPAPGTFNKPAPTGTATLASAFGGSNPNGVWSLYVRDDGAPDTGTIAGGWCITPVLKATPTIATTASPTITLGAGTLTDAATVSGRTSAVAGATVTFNLYGPNNATCTGTPVFTSTVSQPATNGPVVSASFTPTQVGTYRWIASYSGDANNNAVTGACNDPNESVLVAPRRTAGDYDGNGTADRAVYRNGAWYVDGQATVFFGVGSDIPVPGDYDGNGTTDKAVYRNGAWYINGQPTVFLGLASDIPVPGDYDGNGTTDAAVFRPSTGAWYVNGQSTVYLGLSGDIPVPGDYDGNGTTDRAVFRNGVWYINGQATVFLGLSGDIPVPGDYDANGTTDQAVFRNGAWYTNGQASVFFGLSGDIPQPGDYNADASMDRAVFRNGAWYTNGQPTVFLGLTGDVPLSLPQAIYRVFF